MWPLFFELSIIVPCVWMPPHEPITVNEAKYNSVRVTDSGKEVWWVNREPMSINRVDDAAK